jgi:thiamine-phosphate pyrophosphorylase
VNPLLRIIDANLNRAREALRVMEDVARFALNAPELMGRLKQIRHGLQSVAEMLPCDRAMLLASRDSVSDVGTSVKTASEFSRQDVPGLAAAAASRLTEALRSIEESAKALQAPDAASAVERLRYRSYEADRLLTQCLGCWGRRGQWRLCVLLTELLCARHWLDVANAAVSGGADCLQLREKGLESGELLRRARALVQLARPMPVTVIINDRPDVALLAGADGVHLGQSDLTVKDVRAIAGTRLLVGVSTENVEQARVAVEAGADYCGIGPMFATTTKHKPRLAGPAYLREYLSDERLAAVPHLAIGGVTPGNVAELKAAGVRGVAVSSVVCGAEDPAAVCRALVSGIG